MEDKFIITKFELNINGTVRNIIVNAEDNLFRLLDEHYKAKKHYLVVDNDFYNKLRIEICTTLKLRALPNKIGVSYQVKDANNKDKFVGKPQFALTSASHYEKLEKKILPLCTKYNINSFEDLNKYISEHTIKYDNKTTNTTLTNEERKETAEIYNYLGIKSELLFINQDGYANTNSEN